MNQRIFELAKQADIIQWDTLPSGARTPDHESVVKAKKFAELIVKECAKVVDIWSDEVPPSEGYDKLTVGKLKEHFGVE